MSSALQDRPAPVSVPPDDRRSDAGGMVIAVATLVVLAVVAVVAVVVRGGGGDAAPAGALTIATDLSDFAITTAVTQVPAGATILLDVVNSGAIVHDVQVDDGTKTPLLEPGQSDTMTFQAPAGGTVRLLCTVPGHEAAGMVSTLEVTPAR